MEYLQAILFILIITAILYYFVWRKRNNTTENHTVPDHGTTTGNDNQTPPTDYSGMKPKELMHALLRDLNCRVMEDEEDSDRMHFTFQGETFCAIASDDCLLVTVYKFSWGSVPLDDIDEVSRLRKVINNVNFNFGGLCVVYTMDTDDNRMMVHTKRQFLLTPEIPNILDYITAMLTGFFEVQRALTHELDRLRMESKK